MCTSSSVNRTQFIQSLYAHDAVKFGQFKLKSGIMSPVYFDLRALVSLPGLLRDASILLHDAAKDMTYSHICGVPYTALPIATVMSVDNNIPMVMRRKEMKDYGTKKMVEGLYEQGDRCLIVEDVITTGGSVLETVTILEEAGLSAKQAVVLLDREQGGAVNLKNKGITFSSVFQVSEILDILQSTNDIDNKVAADVKQFLDENQMVLTN